MPPGGFPILAAAARPAGAGLLGASRGLATIRGTQLVSGPASPSSSFDGTKHAVNQLKRILWKHGSKFPHGFRTTFVERRRIPPTLHRHVMDERKRYVLANQDRWALLDLLMKERDREVNRA